MLNRAVGPAPPGNRPEAARVGFRLVECSGRPALSHCREACRPGLGRWRVRSEQVHPEPASPAGDQYAPLDSPGAEAAHGPEPRAVFGRYTLESPRENSAVRFARTGGKSGV